MVPAQPETLVRTVTRLPLRLAISAAHLLLKAVWFVRRPRTFGVHAVAITKRGTIVLVKLRYARGWRIPGGGRKTGEEPREAVLRELREEIGLIAHGSVELVCELEETPDFKRDTAAIFIVRDVDYAPAWSIEVEAVMEAAMDALPADLSPRARRWLAAIGPVLKE